MSRSKIAKTAAPDAQPADAQASQPTTSSPQTVSASPPPEAAKPDPTGKLGAMLALMRRDGGATLGELIAATGWQAHSVRGAIAGHIKKKLGLTVSSTRSELGRVYAVEPARS